MENNLKEKSHLLIPFIFSLIFVLGITLSNEWPLSWDIYTHINYALTYSHNGLTTVDYLLNAPSGKVIGYPPMFHIILIIVSKVCGNNFIMGARLLQVILAVANVLAVSYVADKFFDKNAGLFAGMVLISSFMFTRLILPIPETLALLLFTFTVYFYYKSFTESNYKYSILTAIFSLLILVTHFSSFVYLMVLLVFLMIIQTFISRSFNPIEYYVYTILPIFLIGIVAIVLLFLLSPAHISQILNGIVAIINNPFDLFMGQVAMGLERYIRCIGLLSLILSILGLYYSVKTKKLFFVSIWALISFIFTNMHWFGVPVYTFRLLIYLIIPMAILSGFAVSNVIEDLEYRKNKWTKIFIFALIILSVLLCGIHIMDSSTTNFNAASDQSTFQIAPPTSEEVELINWFKNENVENKSILINNLYLGTVLSSVDEIPIHYGFDVYTNKSLTKSSRETLNNEKIGYIVYDKSLVMNNSSDNGLLDVRYVNGSYYPSYYFTKEIDKNNFNIIKLQSSEIKFENDRFIVCKLE